MGLARFDVFAILACVRRTVSPLSPEYVLRVTPSP